MTPAQMATFQRVEGILGGASQPVPGAAAQSLEAAARPALAEVEGELRRMGLVMGPAQIANLRRAHSDRARRRRSPAAWNGSWASQWAT